MRVSSAEYCCHLPLACLPQARYFSIQTYTDKGGSYQYPTPTGNLSSALTDYEIVPEPGSANPWVNPGAVPDGKFTVTIT